MEARKRWLAVARPRPGGWVLGVEPVGDVGGLLARLAAAAAGGPVALGVDFPLGVPRGFAALHCGPWADFPAYLRGLADRPGVFEVAETLDQVGGGRPFYPRRGVLGMTRLSHARALGLEDAAALSRACDRATAERPAGAPVFWTLGANQSGKAAIAGWRDLLLPAMRGTPMRGAPMRGAPMRGAPGVSLWPFDGPFRALLQPGRVAVAEAYPAEALRQLGLRPIGSKRRQADRAALAPGLRGVMAGLGAVADGGLERLLQEGFGADAAGEDRLDCVLGVLGVLQVVAGRRSDAAPTEDAIRRWEGWVLGQSW